MDETGMTTIMIAFTENQAKADSVAQLLTTLVEHDIDTKCAHTWFTAEAYNRDSDIKYNKENNTFISLDKKMMDYLLSDERQGTIKVEGILDESTPAPEQKRGSNQSFVSFGTTLGKTKDTTYPQTPGNDSTSSPTDI
jgi:hypothetical protein